ncbi:TPA: hypothetical protein U1C81_001619 [Streptococcus suis]|nr:zinc ribbon domain-containing protein [Streptococcus suis]MBO4109272.1 hypothetical protein [Streptococcus suis]HEM3667837.1 hypothetical protein [Streptococcus suis]HEM3721901.1 hypothetical protein [Streptococcus suis]
MAKLKEILVKATIECPYCGQKTSDRAERCAHCHNKL